eukprot:GFUD01029368.1.p1 GENE.GFUD01029368.1~~GFUD01029368.1.p1  ORF type:complete len:325 (+),score=90.71 GFUD01029368.1:118-1092(+)
MSTLTLFGSSLSSLSHSVHMALDLLNLKYTYIEVNVQEGGTRTPDFLSLNPHQSVPVLVDSNLIITESSAAITYLVSQYSPSHLYPECGAKKRSQIDQRLQFNIGKFYKRMGDCVYPVCLGKTVNIDSEKIEALKECLMWINQMTVGGYVLDSSMTIADLAFLSTMSTLEACNLLDLSPYKNLQVWLDGMKKQVPNYENNCQKGAAEFGNWFQENYKANKTRVVERKDVYKEDTENDEGKSDETYIVTETVSKISSSDYASSTDYTFSASDDGSYTPVSYTPVSYTPVNIHLDGAGQRKGGAALARQMMMIVAPALGSIPLLKQ